MTLTVDCLNQIEREADIAPATMLRRRLADVRTALSSVSGDLKDHAGALLLKLEHRLDSEIVVETVVSKAPVYLQPRIDLVEDQLAAA